VLMLVISSPHPTKPSDVAADRLSGLRWIDSLRERAIVRFAYPKLGRGMVALFDVSDPEQLQTLLQQWGDFVPCTFEVIPLIDAERQRELLGPGNGRST
jgi:hypothetical protein